MDLLSLQRSAVANNTCRVKVGVRVSTSIRGKRKNSGTAHRTGQDKTKQNKNKTRQGKARQDNTTQEQDKNKTSQRRRRRQDKDKDKDKHKGNFQKKA